MGAPVPVGSGPFSVIVDPSGRFAYVQNQESNNITSYTINATTGALTALGAPVAAGSSPSSIITIRITE